MKTRTSFKQEVQMQVESGDGNSLMKKVCLSSNTTIQPQVEVVDVALKDRWQQEGVVYEYVVSTDTGLFGIRT